MGWASVNDFPPRLHFRHSSVWHFGASLQLSLTKLRTRIMEDLVFLRELMRNPEARGHTSDVNDFIRRTAFDTICVRTVA